MINEYFIAPDDINKLINVCETFDNACQFYVDNGHKPEFDGTHEFGFSFEQLRLFAEKNPTFDYQKNLPNHKKIIAYFFSNEIVYYERKARLSYEKRMKYYN
jgi:hypothetical protein